jgi:hypothetical protein
MTGCLYHSSKLTLSVFHTNNRLLGGTKYEEFKNLKLHFILNYWKICHGGIIKIGSWIWFIFIITLHLDTSIGLGENYVLSFEDFHIWYPLLGGIKYEKYGILKPCYLTNQPILFYGRFFKWSTSWASKLRQTQIPKNWIISGVIEVLSFQISHIWYPLLEGIKYTKSTIRNQLIS